MKAPRVSRKAAVTADTSALVSLFRVRFMHSYYNANGDRCPDFAITPTNETAALMRSIGFYIHDQGDGFIVALPRDRLGALASAVAGGSRQRLGVMLGLTNSDFIGFTALPIEFSPTRQTIYVSNLVTHGVGPARSFGAKAVIGADALLPITGPSVTFSSRRAGTVTVRDIFGQPVARVATAAGAATTLSLASLPCGRYTLSGVPAAAYVGPAAVALMPPTPVAAGLIDLVLVQPADGQGDPAAFPLSVDGTPIAPVDLALRFEARATYWKYYVVTGEPANAALDLSISGAGTAFTKGPAMLPNGDSATLFAATDPLPMRQHASACFSLSGQRGTGHGQRDNIHIARLPNAPSAPVWPAPRKSLAGTSEIFVYL